MIMWDYDTLSVHQTFFLHTGSTRLSYSDVKKAFFFKQKKKGENFVVADHNPCKIQI